MQELPSPYRLSLKRSPNDGAVADGELSQAVAGQYAALGDVKRVHDGYDVVASGAGPLDVFQKLARDQIMHVAPEIGWMQCHPPLHVVEEEHAEPDV